MIRKFEITGVHVDPDEKLKKYVMQCVNKLERYIPKHARDSVHVDVKLKESKRQQDKQCMAEIIMYLPKETLTAKESTINLFAAVDIVEAKLRNQLKKYKDTHTDPRLYRRLTNKFRRNHPNEI
ncbi:ribosome-associated translation inhibitor RaiA [Candidatus Saccharibacteria bacterium]|nr:ribosome-associated translation inhibitor RaiA [Candidatus Saccharibacteria bacterium]